MTLLPLGENGNNLFAGVPTSPNNSVIGSLFNFNTNIPFLGHINVFSNNDYTVMLISIHFQERNDLDTLVN